MSLRHFPLSSQFIWICYIFWFNLGEMQEEEWTVLQCHAQAFVLKEPKWPPVKSWGTRRSRFTSQLSVPFCVRNNNTSQSSQLRLNEHSQASTNLVSLNWWRQIQSQKRKFRSWGEMNPGVITTATSSRETSPQSIPWAAGESHSSGELQAPQKGQNPKLYLSSSHLMPT